MLGVMGIPEGVIHIEQFAPKIEDPNAAGGETWIPNYIEGLSLRPGFEVVRAVGLVRDADRGARSKFESTRAHLRNGGLPVPRRHAELARVGSGDEALTVGVFIMPDGQRGGSLEDLYLDAIAYESDRTRDRALLCVDSFLSCLDPRSRLPAARRKRPASMPG